MILWKCKTCGNGGRGPQRPRRDSTVRYCLPCSAKAGTLVERVAPSLERKRAKAATKRTSKAAKAKAREEAKPYYLRDDLLRKDFAKVLKVAKRIIRKERKANEHAADRVMQMLDMAHLAKIRRSRSKLWTTGRIYTRTTGEVTMTIGTQDRSRAGALAFFIHEISHAMLDWTDDFASHGPEFRSRMAELARAVFPKIREWDAPAGRHIWYLDQAIAGTIRRYLEEEK